MKNRNRTRDFPGRGPKRSFEAPGRPAKAGGAAREFTHRNNSGQVWLFGRHACLAALSNRFRTCHRLLVSPEAAQRMAGEIEQAGQQRQAPIPQPEILGREQFDAVLPRGSVHQGIAVLTDPLPEMSLDEITHEAPANAIIVVLDQVTDPHNVGAILRSADAFGALAVVTTERNAPEHSATLAKAASGASERVPLIRVVNLARALDDLKKREFWCLGLDAEGTQTLAQAKSPHRTALVLGAEGAGLRRLTAEKCDVLVRLPMQGAMPSLNVSNAAAVALYELRRP